MSSNKGEKETGVKTIESEQTDLVKNPVKYATSEPGVYDENPHDKEYIELTLKSGQHSDLVKKILRQRIEKRSADFPRWPADCYSGVRVMWLESRFWYDRERLSGTFDEDWRRYRAHYLHSLNLHPDEPLHIPEYEQALINPIRRFYMKPGDWLEKNVIQKFITKEKPMSQFYRSCVSRFILSYLGLMAGYYYIRYHFKTWESRDGPLIWCGPPRILPGDPLFPWKDPLKEPAHFKLDNFDRRTIFKDLRDFEDRTVF